MLKKMKQPKSDAAKLCRVVDEILWRMWDPLEINDEENCRDEYQSYAYVLTGMLGRGADKHEIAQYLAQLQSEAMGLSGMDKRRTEQTAQEICTAYGQLR
ncbi:hypothetical protein ACFPVS_05005 [Neisseria weixii]|nr:hypothetical protein [Neisseria weixii]